MKMEIPTLGEPSRSPGTRRSTRRGSCLKSAARALRATCGGAALNNGVPWAAASTFWLRAAMSAGTAAAVNRVGDRWMARLDKQRRRERRVGSGSAIRIFVLQEAGRAPAVSHEQGREHTALRHQGAKLHLGGVKHRICDKIVGHAFAVTR